MRCEHELAPADAQSVELAAHDVFDVWRERYWRRSIRELDRDVRDLPIIDRVPDLLTSTHSAATTPVISAASALPMRCAAIW
jgi:hypothetical protein